MFFVFDTETIPDIDLIRSSVVGDADTEEALLELATEQLAKNKQGFLPPMYHRMVCWVGLWVDESCNPKALHRWVGVDEAEGIRELMQVLREYKDFGIVHHNGKGFDLPLLTYRSMKHHIQMVSRLGHHEIKYRYSKHNIDLVDELSNFGASSWPKLKQLGLLIGVPFKQTAEGDRVIDMFKAQQLEQIEQYCTEDVMATYIVWLNYRHTTGELKTDHYQHLLERAIQKLKHLQTSAI
jgi:hypothetical protein